MHEGKRERGKKTKEGRKGEGRRTGSGTPHALQALRKLLMFSICLNACTQSCSRGRGGGSSHVASHAHVRQRQGIKTLLMDHGWYVERRATYDLGGLDPLDGPGLDHVDEAAQHLAVLEALAERLACGQPDMKDSSISSRPSHAGRCHLTLTIPSL